jgi:phospholipid/cholesterol/gamma-HCH transport system permease protein
MPEFSVDPTGAGTLTVSFSGSWTINDAIPDVASLQTKLQGQQGSETVAFRTQDLKDWDSGFLTFLTDLKDYCDRNQIAIDGSGLPEGVLRLLKLAYAVPEKAGARKEQISKTFFQKVGENTVEMGRSTGEFLSFLGDATLSFSRLLRGKATFPRADFMAILVDCGSSALPIVSLISLLVGLILAFVGAIQLEMFGAQIYVANLVGIATAREMGAMMTAIIMAGRTGAAFAAQLGTMQVNEEIDALRTFGVEPMDFLVLPRMLALILMMPILCLYADLLGLVGGGIVGVGMLDISMTQYIQQTISGLTPTDFLVGLVKSVVYGVIVALSGCLRGMQCGRSASAVGLAATSAVVMGIVLIILTDGLFAVVTNILGI